MTRCINRAAVEEGIVPGGGVALLRASEQLKHQDPNDDQKTGVEIVARRSARQRQIAHAGEDGSVIVGKILEEQYSYGFDSQTANTATWSARASRPTKVVRAAIRTRSLGCGPADHHRSHGGRAEEELRRRRRPSGSGMGGMGFWVSRSELLQTRKARQQFRVFTRSCAPRRYIPKTLLAPGPLC